MPNNGSPNLQPGAALTAGYYAGGGAAAVKVATGSVISGAVVTWNILGGTTQNSAPLDIPIPSGLETVLAVLVVLSSTQWAFVSTQGYADNLTSTVLENQQGTLIVAGASLSLTKTSIVVAAPAAANTSCTYTIYYT